MIEPPTSPAPRGPRGVRIALGGITALGFALYAALCERKLRFFLYDDLDLGLFTQAVDRVLHGSFHNSIRGMNWLGDHSSLILVLLAPLAALAPGPLTLLVFQSAALALGAIPCFLLARRELGDERLALGCAALYLASPALGYVALFEFHPEALATAPLLACFYFLRSGRGGACLAFAALALLAREDVALVVLGLAAYGAFAMRPRRMGLAAGLATLGAVSLALTFLVLQPAFNHGGAEYGRMYAAWGGSAREVLVAILQDPMRALGGLFATPGDPLDSRLKLEFFLHLLLPVGFLALASPAALLIALPVVAEHLLSSRGQQHTVVFQYTALITPFVIAATILGMRNLSHWGGGEGGAPARARRLLLFAAVLTIAAQGMFGPVFGRRVLQSRGPIQSLAPDGAQRAEARYRAAFLARVPAGRPAVAGFEFLPRLASRAELHSLHHVASGRHNYSSRPYPIPSRVEALIADLSGPRLLPFVDAGTSHRLSRLIEENGLVPADAAGDLVLFLRDVDSVPLIGPAPESGSALPQPIAFERELELRGAGIGAAPVRPGERLTLVTTWRRTAPIARLYYTRWLLLDARGEIVHQHLHALGYLAYPPADWPVGADLAETYRLVIPEGLAPGRYTLAVQIGWRRGAETAVAATGDPALDARAGVIPLGSFGVAAPR